MLNKIVWSDDESGNLAGSVSGKEIFSAVKLEHNYFLSVVGTLLIFCVSSLPEDYCKFMAELARHVEGYKQVEKNLLEEEGSRIKAIAEKILGVEV